VAAFALLLDRLLARRVAKHVARGLTIRYRPLRRILGVVRGLPSRRPAIITHGFLLLGLTIRYRYTRFSSARQHDLLAGFQ
jgi:hypothetical protein